MNFEHLDIILDSLDPESELYATLETGIHQLRGLHLNPEGEAKAGIPSILSTRDLDVIYDIRAFLRDELEELSDPHLPIAVLTKLLKGTPHAH